MEPVKVTEENKVCRLGSASNKNKRKAMFSAVTSSAANTAISTAVAAIGSNNAGDTHVEDVAKQDLQPSRKRPRGAGDWLIHPPDGSVSDFDEAPTGAIKINAKSRLSCSGFDATFANETRTLISTDSQYSYS